MINRNVEDAVGVLASGDVRPDRVLREGSCTARGSVRARRLTLATLLALTAALLSMSAPALAAAPEAPELTVASPVNATEATFLGILSPKATEPNEGGAYKFLYRASKTECEGGSETAPGLSLGLEHEELAAEPVTGLTASTEYTVCLSVTNLKSETTLSPPVTFKTATPPEAPETLPADSLTATAATLHGVLNPKATGEAGTYEFLYRASATECQGEAEHATGATPALGHAGEAVSAAVNQLLPATEYTFCLLARNEAGETALGAPVTFTTSIQESFSNVGSTSATLNAQVNPGGSPSTFFFEYGPSAAYGSTTPAESLGSGTGSLGVLAQLSGLQPDTLYHFRVVVTNASSETTDGADGSFATSPLAILGLPDGRSYEVVSSLGDGDAAVVEPLTPGGFARVETGALTQLPFRAAANGGALAFVGAPPAAGGNGSYGNGNGNEYLAKRSPAGGWTQTSVQPGGLTSPQYQSFSSDLSIGIFDSNEAVTASAPGEKYNVLYSRLTSDGGYRPLFTSIPPDRTHSEFETVNVKFYHRETQLVYAGGSSDLSHLLFEANDALAAQPQALDGGREANNLYDSFAGGLRLVNVLPDGEPAPDATFGSAVSLGDPPQPDFDHVISEDGSRIFWTDLNTHQLFVRENDAQPPSPLGPKGECTVPADACTVQIDASQVPGPGGGGLFWTATTDGSRVFFTDEQQLTADSTAAPEAPDLYEYDVNTGHLIDLSVDASAGEHANVQGVLGVSQDGSYVYFAAGGALAAGATSQTCIGENFQSQCNLYVVHAGEAPRLIASVAAEADGGLHGGGGGVAVGDWQFAVGDRTARVTADGRRLVFQSELALTAYKAPPPLEGGLHV